MRSLNRLKIYDANYGFLRKSLLPPTAKRFVELHQVRRYIGGALRMLQFRLQQGSFSVEDRDKIGNSGDVPRPGKSQRPAGVVDLILQAGTPLLLRPVRNQRIDNFVPSLKHCLVIGNGRFLLLDLAQLQGRFEAASVEDWDR